MTLQELANLLEQLHILVSNKQFAGPRWTDEEEAELQALASQVIIPAAT